MNNFNNMNLRHQKPLRINALNIKRCKRGFTISALLVLLFLPLISYSQDWVYSVRPGDTLWGLCKSHTVKSDCWQKIGPYNRVEYPKTLQPGTRIKFPTAWLIKRPQNAKIIYLFGAATFSTSSSLILKPLPLRVNHSLQVGDQIWLKPGAIAGVQFADQTVMTILGGLEGSDIIFDQITMGDQGPITDTKVRLNKGNIQTKVPKKAPAIQFEVTTPSVVAAVRGTEFYLQASEDTTAHGVLKGSVGLENSLNTTEVPAGFGIIAGRNKPLTKPEKLLSPPTLIVNSSAKPDAPWNLAKKIQWSPVLNATHYTVELTNKNDLIIYSKLASTTSHRFKSVPVGCYQIRLSAVSQSTLKGLPSSNTGCQYQPLSKPKDLDLKNLHLSWTPVEGASRYRIVIINKNKDIVPTTHYAKTANFILNENPAHIFAIEVNAEDDGANVGKPKRLQLAPKPKNGWLYFTSLALILIGL